MSAMRTDIKFYFRHCGFIFTGYAPAMDLPFSEQLAGYAAVDIIAALSCPRATAYDWKDGRRHPPLWQQPIFIREIESYCQRFSKAERILNSAKAKMVDQPVKKARKKPKGG